MNTIESQKETKKISKKIKIIALVLIAIVVLGVLLIVFLPKNKDFITKFSTNVNEYNFEINVDCENKSLDCKQSVSYINNSNDNLKEIKFHVYANNFSSSAVNKPVSSLYTSSAYPNGESFGEFSLNSLTAGSNTSTQFKLDGTDKDILIVYLEDSLNPKERITISMDYSLELPNINHRYGYGNNTINLGNFYPIACVYENGVWREDHYTTNGDPFYSDMANYNANITYNKNFMLASSGVQLNSTEQDNTKTTSITAKAVRDFAFVLSDKFKMLEQVVDSTKILYYYYGDTNPEQSLKTSVDALNTFNQMIGAYEYPTLSVVESNFVYGGMEYPTLVMISDNLDEHEDYEYTIVHEIGHQWFYGMVGNNEFDNGWMDEGLTEYITACFYEKNKDYNKDIKDIINNAEKSYMLFVEVYGTVLGEVDTSMNRPLNKYNTDPEYTYTTYVKGMLMFHNLRSVVGEQKFFKSLQNYFENFKGKNATPENMISCFEKTSKANLKNYFNSYLEGKVKVIEINK